MCQHVIFALHESFPGGASVLSAGEGEAGQAVTRERAQSCPTAWKKQDFGGQPKSVNQNTKNVAPSPLVQGTVWSRTVSLEESPCASLNNSSLSALVSASKLPPKGLRSPHKKRGGGPTVSRAEMFASWIQAHGIQAESKAFQAENVDRAFMGADAEDGVEKVKDQGNGHVVHAGSEEEQRGKNVVWHLQGSAISKSFALHTFKGYGLYLMS